MKIEMKFTCSEFSKAFPTSHALWGRQLKAIKEVTDSSQSVVIKAITYFEYQFLAILISNI